MDLIGLAIAALIGYAIFSEDEETRKKREAAEEAYRQQEPTDSTIDAEDQGSGTSFATSSDCFEAEYLSFSRLGTYAACPRRFKLLYLDKQKTQSKWFFGRGKLFHASIASYLSDYLGQPVPDMQTASLLAEIDSQEAIHGWAKDYKAELKLDDPADFVCRTLPRDAEVIGVEHELSYTVGDIKFYGIVDLALRYPDGSVELIDFKTGKRSPTREQLELYCLPFAQMPQAKPVRLRYILADKKYHHCWSVTPRRAGKLAKHFRGLVERILKDFSFNPVRGSHCSSCGVSVACMLSDSYGGLYDRRSYKPRVKLTRMRRRKPNINPFTYSETAEKAAERAKKRRASTRRRGGRSFGLVRAKSMYVCCRSGETISPGELHFANHSGRRMTLEAFEEAFPEAYGQIQASRDPSAEIRVVTVPGADQVEPAPRPDQADSQEMSELQRSAFDGGMMAKTRKCKGLNQGELAKIVGRNRVTISDLERGVLSPCTEIAASIAIALGIDVEALYSAVSEPIPGDAGDLTAQERSVVEFMRSVSGELRQRLVRFAKNLAAKSAADE